MLDTYVVRYSSTFRAAFTVNLKYFRKVKSAVPFMLKALPLWLFVFSWLAISAFAFGRMGRVSPAFIPSP